MENLLETIDNIATGNGYDLTDSKTEKQQAIAVKALAAVESVLFKALTKMNINGGHFGIATDAQDAIRNYEMERK